MFSRTGCCCLIVVLGLLVSTTASADEAKEAFDRGIKASKSGDYTEALEDFKAAEQAGLNTTALKYNLAVSYYKLQQYETARILFAELTDEPTFEQLAYFNLGLIANKQKDEAAAIRWFQRAYRDLSNENVRALAAEALKRLGVNARETRQSGSDWTGTVSSSLTYDSNVALLNDGLDGVSGESDTALDLSASAGRWLKGNMNDGVRLRLGASLQKYSQLSENDESQLSARILRYDRLGDWKVRLGGSWDEVYYDGHDYQRIISADARGLLPLSNVHQLRLRYKLSHIQSTEAVYEYLEGWRQQFRVGLQEPLLTGTTRYYYQLELNDRDDYYGSGGTFTSYSPTRHTLSATGWWDLVDRLRLRLDARFRYSHYNDKNILADGSTEQRDDKQSRLSSRISREFAPDWEMHAQYIYTRNDSNVDRKSYNRSQISAGVDWSF